MDAEVNFDDKYLEGAESYVENEKGQPWWDAIADKNIENEDENKKCAELLDRRTKHLATQCFGKFNNIKKYEDFYNMDMEAITYDQGYKKSTSCNLLRIGVNAIHSMIGKEMPTINFMTTRAPYPVRRNVGLLNDYIQAEFEHSGLYRNVRSVVRDGACSNLGVVKVYLDEGTNHFMTDRIPPRNILVDDTDQMYDRKREVFERRLVSRYYLESMLPDLKPWQKEIIKEKARENGTIICYEGYYQNKIHVIFIDECLLFMEDWEEWPPYFYWRWTEKTNSFFGKGICEEGWNVQNNLNKLYFNYDKSVNMFSKNKIIMTGSGRYTSTNISDTMEILRMHGSDVSPKSIQFVTPPIMHPQHFQLAETYKQDFFLSTSLSQLTASGQKEKGVYTASGAMAVHDIQQSRFAQTSQALVDMYVDIARFMVREASRRFYSTEGNRTLIEKINWRDLDLEENYHYINEAPMSRLSKDPAQRQAQLINMQAAGWISPQRALEKFDVKDYKEEMDLVTSSERLIEKTLNEILEGKRREPSPHIPMQLQYEVATKFYNREVCDELDEDTEEAVELRRYLDTCNKKVQLEIQSQKMAQMQAFMEAQKGAPKAPPQGGGGPPGK